MRHTHQGALGHARHLIDGAFNLGRIDVVSAADDQVFAATHNRYISVGIDPTHVAGLEEAVGGELLARLLRHAPIAGEYVGAAHLYTANLPHGKCVAGIVMHAQLDTWQRESHRATAALPVRAVVGVGGQHRRFGHPVTLQEGVTGTLLPVPERLQKQWGRTGDEQAHGANRRTVKARLGKQTDVQGRHAHENRGLRHFFKHRARIKLREPDHLAAVEQSAVQGHEQAVHMKNRQGVDQHITALLRWPPAPIILQNARIGEQVAVCQHGALAAPGGATGVQDGSQVVPLSHDWLVLVATAGSALQQRPAAVVIEGEDAAAAGLERDLAHPAEIAC